LKDLREGARLLIVSRIYNTYEIIRKVGESVGDITKMKVTRR